MNETPIRVRPATIRDLGAVTRIERESFDDPWPPRVLVGELTTDRMRVPLVACRGDEVLGYLMAWCVIDQMHILNLAVQVNVRQQGVATLLLEDLLALCRRQNYGEVTLEVRRSNRSARAFYDRHGFRSVGRRPGYYRDNGEDAIIMTLDLRVDPA